VSKDYDNQGPGSSARDTPRRLLTRDDPPGKEPVPSVNPTDWTPFPLNGLADVSEMLLHTAHSIYKVRMLMGPSQLGQEITAMGQQRIQPILVAVDTCASTNIVRKDAVPLRTLLHFRLEVDSTDSRLQQRRSALLGCCILTSTGGMSR
jgi:hypothetical protein